MSALILYLLLWLWDNRDFDSISKANERKLGAERAYENKKYADAANLYNQITYGSLFSDPAVRLNMAHSYYQAGKLDLALRQYQLLTRVDNRAIASIAFHQIALIEVTKKDTASALSNLKMAIRMEPGNDMARSNFVVLKSNFSGIQDSPDRNEKAPKKERLSSGHSSQEALSGASSLAQETEQNLKREQLLQSLKEINMTEEQARAILDAMKSNESQYIYQLRRKQYAEKTEKNEKIEW